MHLVALVMNAKKDHKEANNFIFRAESCVFLVNDKQIFILNEKQKRKYSLVIKPEGTVVRATTGLSLIILGHMCHK